MSHVKKIVVTADDFGRSPENNKGILAAYQAGLLTTTSLMVGEPGLNEALAISQRNPDLPIGLHVCLCDGTPVLPPEKIPLLVVNEQFPFDERKLYAAVLSKAGRAQIRAEIAAQFRLFFQARLLCDHVDVHRHSHLHPFIANEVFRATAIWKIKKVRIPYDPVIGRPFRIGDPFRYARALALRQIARHYGLTWINNVIGRDWTDSADLAQLIDFVPNGVTELYFHPVICDDDHRFKADLSVFLDDQVRNALTGIRCDEYLCS